MKIFLRPAPGTLRLALFCFAFLALAWWAGTAGGTVSIATKYQMPPSPDSISAKARMTEAYQKIGEIEEKRNPLDREWHRWFEKQGEAFNELQRAREEAREDTTPAFNIKSSEYIRIWGIAVDTTSLKPEPSWASCSDSIAARVEGMEARQKWGDWKNTLGRWTCILLVLLNAVFLGLHSNKHWKDAHKP